MTTVLGTRVFALAEPAPAAFLISDLHVPADGGQALAHLHHAVAAAEAARAALFVLGDLFDSYVCRAQVRHGVWRDVAARFAAAGRAGVRVTVLHGNRDFLLGAGFEARSGCRLLPDPVVTTLYGERVLLTHGDLLCTGDAAYQELRTTVRGAYFQREVARLSLEQRELLAAAARAGSRAHTSTVRAEIMDVDPGALAALVRAAGVGTIVHGHTHRPAIHAETVDGKPLRRIVLDAWYERGSALRWSADGIETLELPFAA